MNDALSRRLKCETAALHAVVERTGVMATLLRGELPREDYCRLLANLHAVYVELEAGLGRHAADERVAPVCLPALFRQQALEADLERLAGADWTQTLCLASATARYARRLRQLAESAPELLAAHAYVRYLGDLHGGQILARVAARGIGCSEDRGFSFYDFGTGSRVRELRQALRSGLDALPSDQDAVVSEARSAFELHRELFAELAGEGDAGDSQGR